MLGQGLAIQYKPGAGGAASWSQLNGMQPDGYTVMGTNLSHIVLQPLEKDVGYKTDDITTLGGQDIIIGGRYADTINAGAGDNLVIGGSGRRALNPAGASSNSDPWARARTSSREKLERARNSS